MRRSEVKRKSPLRRHVRVRPRNARRRKRLFAKNYGPQARLCWTMPCFSCGAPAPSQASHLKARGMGGCNSGDGWNAPQCSACHRALESEGIVTFFAKRGIDKDAVLERMRMLVLDQNNDALPMSPLLAWLDGP